MYEIKPSSGWNAKLALVGWEEPTGVPHSKGGRPMGRTSTLLWRLATIHHQNHFVGRGCLKSSSPLRRLLLLSVDVADAVALPHIRRGSLFFLEPHCSAQPLTWWARFLSFSSRFRPCIR